MTRRWPVALVNMAFSWIVHRGQREALLGDLAEEFALRANSASTSCALRWYLRQVRTSIVPLLCSRIAQSRWLATAGVAMCAYMAVGIIEFLVNWVTVSPSMTGNAAYNPLGMFITFPMVVIVALVAAQSQRRSPFVLAAMMLVSVTAMALWGSEHLPTWYLIAYFFAGPTATLLGSSLHSFRSARKR